NADRPAALSRGHARGHGETSSARGSSFAPAIAAKSAGFAHGYLLSLFAEIAGAALCQRHGARTRSALVPRKRADQSPASRRPGARREVAEAVSSRIRLSGPIALLLHIL